METWGRSEDSCRRWESSGEAIKVKRKIIKELRIKTFQAFIIFCYRTMILKASLSQKFCRFLIRVNHGPELLQNRFPKIVMNNITTWFLYLLLSTSLIFVLASSSHFWSRGSFRQNWSTETSKVTDIEAKLSTGLLI